uniref:Succinate dehydrogenase subunit 4 n=1 Tax=Cyanophora paradoxa TaxID=2762 RepID=E9P1C7_CYAPA|nr:succinate dehydrogenase subunit 4 [Cyanophora paradoxa]ADW79179.1 succinate dehydrogenase subunit 4 [Cyanophora paradoxa]
MNLLNRIKLGKQEWYTQKITSLFILSPLMSNMNILIVIFFMLFVHIELGIYSTLEDYYQNIILRLMFDFALKCIFIFSILSIYTGYIFIIV